MCEIYSDVDGVYSADPRVCPQAKLIPELSSEQLKKTRRVGRPPLGRAPRELIAIRIDPDVLRALRTEATQTGIGYQTLIHRLLAEHVRHTHD